MTQLLNDFLSGSAAWGVLLTLAAFALGALINKLTGKAIFNPLLLGSIFVIVFLSVCKIPYADYKVSAAPVNYLLLPATVALAIPLYEKIDLLKENAAAIIAGISVGTLVSLGSALALALALDLTREQYATLLHMIAQVTGFQAGELVHVIADAHIYDRHVPLVRQLLERQGRPAPAFVMDPEVTDFYRFTRDSFRLEGYDPLPFDEKIPVAI